MMGYNCRDGFDLHCVKHLKILIDISEITSAKKSIPENIKLECRDLAVE